jgi:hypothetical protein
MHMHTPGGRLARSKEIPMIRLSLKDGGTVLGTITEADMQVLVDQLEEEDASDTDYFISPDTIEILAENGASAGLVNLLRRAVGDSDGVEVRWQKT